MVWLGLSYGIMPGRVFDSRSALNQQLFLLRCNPPPLRCLYSRVDLGCGSQDFSQVSAFCPGFPATCSSVLISVQPSVEKVQESAASQRSRILPILGDSELAGGMTLFPFFFFRKTFLSFTCVTRQLQYFSFLLLKNCRRSFLFCLLKIFLTFIYLVWLCVWAHRCVSVRGFLLPS